MTRRTLVKLFAVLAATLLGVVAIVQRLFHPADAPQPQRPAKAPPPEALNALVDTFIPADESPGGVELGIPDKVVAWSRSNPKFQQQLRKTCEWLEAEAQRTAGDSYGALNAAQRNAIVTQIVEGHAGRTMQRFMFRLRNEAMTHYYGDLRGWAATGYDGPPQPNGFLDYTEPPSDA